MVFIDGVLNVVGKVAPSLFPKVVRQGSKITNSTNPELCSTFKRRGLLATTLISTGATGEIYDNC